MAHPAKTATKPRLTPAERRADILACASRAFSEGSFRGTTTAEIARAADVTEPVLYRHFDSKRDLYLACLAESWTRVRAVWEGALADEPDPAEWLFAMGRAFRESPDRVVVHRLWIQAISEASGDAEVRLYMRGHMREVHAFVASVIRRSQKANGIVGDRDPVAEAWIFVAVGLLHAVSGFLGGLIGDDLQTVIAARRHWLTDRR